jgi:hypothetical protein
MPVQTTQTGNIYFPDGAKVQIKESGGSYTDLGALNSAITLTLNWEDNIVNTANAGTLLKQIRNMTVDGSFTLINLNPAVWPSLGGGLFETVTTAGTTVTDAQITDQSIVTFTAGEVNELRPIITADGTVLRFSAAPVLTSVSGSTSGVLAANNDYTVVVAPQFDSGYGIVFNTAGTATIEATETVTIDFGDNDPVASTTLYAGTSTKELTAYALKFTHTDDNSLDREVELYSVDPNSGGIQLNFKGANEDGTEEMPISFTGKLDTSLTDGRQLIRITVDEGAA